MVRAISTSVKGALKSLSCEVVKAGKFTDSKKEAIASDVGVVV